MQSEERGRNIRHEAGAPVTSAISETLLRIASLGDLGPQRSRAFVEAPV